MPRITRWQDYPEFLERFEQEFDLSDEETAQMDLVDIIDRLEERGFKGTTLSSALTLRSMAQYSLPEGYEETRVEFIEKIDRHIWRDLTTGRFTRSPYAE